MEFLKDSIINLGTSIVNGLRSTLEFLFVPGNNLFDDIVNVFNTKFGFVGQVLDLQHSLQDINFNRDLPHFSIKLYGKDYDFIDFSMFDKYRDFILSITRAIATFFFILWLLDTIPSMIYSGTQPTKYNLTTRR